MKLYQQHYVIWGITTESCTHHTTCSMFRLEYPLLYCIDWQPTSLTTISMYKILWIIEHSESGRVRKVQGSRKGDNYSTTLILLHGSRISQCFWPSPSNRRSYTVQIPHQINSAFLYDLQPSEESDCTKKSKFLVIAELYGKWSIRKSSEVFRQISQIVSTSRYL